MIDCSNLQDFGPIKVHFWWSHVPLFYSATDKPAIIPQQNSSLGSAQKTDMLTSASRPQRHHVLAEVCGHTCIVHSQGTWCFFFVGSIAELKVKSWSEATWGGLRQLLLDWLSVMWTSTFPVLLTTTDFVFCKSGVLLFLHHQCTVSY